MNREPKDFIGKIEAFQYVMGSIVGSIWIVVWVTSWDFIINIFKPDFLRLLVIVRVGLAVFGLLLTALIGVRVMIWLLKRGIELYNTYNELVALKKKIKKKDQE